ncbi:PIN2/TERF1-interacting telomerase inhibitor 1 [Portunus trituberculatus]|uniref:PIN2/TERF1-interacting telomerase inhibitor 1 n=1 Tax=Portunus trituberculatus TaxID=210409 RepID=A0A5B7J6U6_PORTR|nr:PIN2/TERF1-interacting telomerase inhibitor 1 [Portunus trituberculatus]
MLRRQGCDKESGQVSDAVEPFCSHWSTFDSHRLDDSKFGQKLMEKMGWSKGHGLGREQQGMKDPLSVKLKDDSKGNNEWISLQ